MHCYETLMAAGMGFVEQKNLDAAQRSFEYAHRLQPRKVEPLHFLAMCDAARDKVQTAAKYMEQASQLKSPNPEVLLALGGICLGRGHFEEAIRFSSKAYDSSLSLDSAQVVLRSLIAAGHLESAEHALTKMEQQHGRLFNRFRLLLHKSRKNQESLPVVSTICRFDLLEQVDILKCV